MIRREIQLADGSPHWLLISQVEHARLSALLAERCLERFPSEPSSASAAIVDAIRQELLEAIRHHDDGWQQWEAAPRMDEERQRPLSFVELPLEQALEVWNGSIDAAALEGDLAAWTVAGHFSALLATSSHHDDDPRAREWLTATGERRHQWFTRWHDRQPQHHTFQIAGEALKWLQLFDVLSLWPCTACPVEGEQVVEWPEPYRTGEGWLLVEEIGIGPMMTGRGEVPPDTPCPVVLRPWPFDRDEVLLEATAHTVPVAAYATPEQLLTARRPMLARWNLVPPR